MWGEVRLNQIYKRRVRDLCEEQRDSASSHLWEVVQRLDHVPLDGELERDELLGQFVLRVAAELQHLSAGEDGNRKSGQEDETTDPLRCGLSSGSSVFPSKYLKICSVSRNETLTEAPALSVCVCVCVSSHPSRDSSPSTAAPSTMHCANVVRGSFFCAQTHRKGLIRNAPGFNFKHTHKKWWKMSFSWVHHFILGILGISGDK